MAITTANGVIDRKAFVEVKLSAKFDFRKCQWIVVWDENGARPGFQVVGKNWRQRFVVCGIVQEFLNFSNSQ